MLKKYAAMKLAVIGKSAGGNLTLSVLNRARTQGLPYPSAVALLSPWVDLANSGRTPATHATYNWGPTELRPAGDPMAGGGPTRLDG